MIGQTEEQNAASEQVAASMDGALRAVKILEAQGDHKTFRASTVRKLIEERATQRKRAEVAEAEIEHLRASLSAAREAKAMSLEIAHAAEAERDEAGDLYDSVWAELIEEKLKHDRLAACSRMGIMDELWRPTTAEPSVTILRDPPIATLERMVRASTGDVDIRIARQMYEAITKGSKS